MDHEVPTASKYNIIEKGREKVRTAALNGDLDVIKGLKVETQKFYMPYFVSAALYFGFKDIPKYFYIQFGYVPAPIDISFYAHSFRIMCCNADLDFIKFVACTYNVFVRPPKEYIISAICEMIQECVAGDLDRLKVQEILTFLFEDCEIEVSDKYFEVANENYKLKDFLSSFCDN